MFDPWMGIERDYEEGSAVSALAPAETRWLSTGRMVLRQVRGSLGVGAAGLVGLGIVACLRVHS